MPEKTWAMAHPSLALIKYWGKSDKERNLPATPSLALTLSGLHSKVEVQAGSSDQVILDGKEQPQERYQLFFDNLRRVTGTSMYFRVQAWNDFPTAAGLASSSSGFAAMAAACAALTGQTLPLDILSGIARLGSGSASRAVYGGFTLLEARAQTATPLRGPEFWPDLRVLLCLVEAGPKAVSSREAMEQTRLTSPYYSAWVEDAPRLTRQACEALEQKDLDRLGPLIRLSYQRMFATMFSADPPILYWKPGSLEIIHLAEELRRSGISVWETMDAGPQVKLFCPAADSDRVRQILEQRLPAIRVIVAGPAPGVRWGQGSCPV